MITCYTIISKNLPLLKWCINNARERAGIDHQWLVIGWNATEEIQAWCQKENIKYYHYMPITEKEEPLNQRRFLKNLYRGWNLGYEQADTEWVCRMGSDQFYSKNWLKDLWDAAQKKGNHIFHSLTIESPITVRSRFLVKPWGTTWDTFQVEKFDAWCDKHRTNRIRPATDGYFFWHPLFWKLQRRADGCTWLHTKELWEKYGPYPPYVLINPPVGNGGNIYLTGDVYFFDKIRFKGIKNFLVGDSVTYHLIQGESRPSGKREISDYEQIIIQELDKICDKFEVNLVERRISQPQDYKSVFCLESKYGPLVLQQEVIYDNSRASGARKSSS